MAIVVSQVNPVTQAFLVKVGTVDIMDSQVILECLEYLVTHLIQDSRDFRGFGEIAGTRVFLDIAVSKELRAILVKKGLAAIQESLVLLDSQEHRAIRVFLDLAVILAKKDSVDIVDKME